MFNKVISRMGEPARKQEDPVKLPDGPLDTLNVVAKFLRIIFQLSKRINADDLDDSKTTTCHAHSLYPSNLWNANNILQMRLSTSPRLTINSCPRSVTWSRCCTVPSSWIWPHTLRRCTTWSRPPGCTVNLFGPFPDSTSFRVKVSLVATTLIPRKRSRWKSQGNWTLSIWWITKSSGWMDFDHMESGFQGISVSEVANDWDGFVKS